MENTCVLTVLPVIPNWKVYNSVPKRSIKYCAILKEKREFQNLIENVALSKNLKNSCSVIDKKIATLKDENSLEIIFLNPEEKDLLSLILTVSKKHLLKRKNNLLIFLKNNGNNLKYQVQDCSIYVNCDAYTKWHIFFNLFEFLLIRYGICNIGAMFYCALFSCLTLKQEIRFLCHDPVVTKRTSYPTPLNLNQSLTSNGDKSLFCYCKKMPKRALCCQNDFSHTVFPTDCQDLTMKILSYLTPNSPIMYRNALINDSISDGIMPKLKIPKLNCFCKEIRCKCHESKWKLHKNISKFDVSCYMDILLMKGVTSNDELCIAQGNANFSNFSMEDSGSSLNNVLENSVPSSELFTTKKMDFHLGESQNGEASKCFSANQHLNFISDSMPAPITSTTRCELKPKPESLLKAINLLNEDVVGKEKVEDVVVLDKLSEKKKGNSAVTAFNVPKSVFYEKEDSGEFSGKITLDGAATAFNLFQTASGKKVKISDKALIAAEKMFNEVMQSDEDPLTVDKTASKEFAENKVNSKKVSSLSIHKSMNLVEIQQGKQLNESIDGMLTDNFFEDIYFDENVDELSDATQSSSMFTNKSEKSSAVGKVRKSLGGRRSLKPYSIPKP